MPISNYNTGFPNGVTIRNNPIVDIQNGNGQVFWVDSNQGSDGNNGNFKYPFATINYAVTQCTPNIGDKIFVAAGHVESVIAEYGLLINVPGITIYFMGEGADRATIDFSTVNTASMRILANNITLVNPRFTADIDGLLFPIIVDAAYFKIENGAYADGIGINSIKAITATENAIYMKIDGWLYIPGDGAGAQKQSQIEIPAVGIEISNIIIGGDFSVAPLNATPVMGFPAATGLFIENLVIRNTNTTPKPGIVLDANVAGQAKNLDIRIASGTTYVSNLAKMNWDSNCLGYNADGTTGDLIGTAAGGSIEAKIDTLLLDVGDAESRTNYPSITEMIGIPDAANSNLDAIIRTGYDSSAIIQNEDGSVLERLEYLQTQTIPGVAGLVFNGSCDAGMTPSTTTIVSSQLAGYGDSIFDLRYYVQVIKNANSVGAAPEGEVKQITAYVSATGTFTTDAFSVNVEENDKILVMHESLVIPGRNDANNAFDSSAVAANASGSLIEREAYIQTRVATVSTNLGDPSTDTLTSVVAKLGNGATTTTADLSTLKTNVGDASGDTLKSVVAKIGDGTVTVVAQLNAIRNVTDVVGAGAIGSEFWIKKSVTSSNITFASPVDISSASTVGELAIEDVIVKTDSTLGLAGGTNFNIISTNVKGNPIFFSELVANLGGAVTVDLAKASLAGVENILETGKKLQIQSTVGDCTGAGTIDIYIKFMRLAYNAQIAAI